MRNFVVKADANGDFPTWVTSPSDTINSIVLVAGVAGSDVVPARAGKVFFSCTGNFYAKVSAAGTVAAIPTAITDGSACDLNPSGYIVAPGDVISVISPVACIVTLAYYH
jgi:hypothetical protein